MLYFEDIDEGDTFELGTETITDEDIVSFARQWDPQPFHLYEESDVPSVFDGLVASGLHTLCLASRLFVNAIDDVANMGGTDIDSIEFRRPVEPGNILSGTARVLETSNSSQNPGRGHVRFELSIENQGGEKVMRAVYGNIVACRVTS